VLFCDKNEVCQYGNPVFFDWFGKNPDEIIGRMNLKAFLGDSNYSKCYGYLENSLKGVKQSFELELSFPDNGSRELSITTVPYSVNDQIVGFFLHFTDLTELNQSEKRKALFENTSKTIFRSFMENSPLPTWIVDSENIVHFLNEAYRKVRPQVKMGQSFLKSFSPEIAAAYQDSNLKILALQQSVTTMEKLQDEVYGERVYKIIKFPLFYKNRYMIGGFAIDITNELGIVKSRETPQ
jgi:hypothetical protein